MDISPPESPINSARGFIAHIATVTCGILIALGLDQLVENHRHHLLVVHARADFLAELQTNRTKVIDARNSDRKIQPVLDTLTHYGEALLKHPPTKPTAPDIGDINRTFGRLSANAWDTALATGALTWMRFPQTRALSYVYRGQTTMNEFEAKAGDQWIDIASFDFDDNLPDPELRSSLHGLRVAAAYTVVLLKLETQLIDAYDRAETELQNH